MTILGLKASRRGRCQPDTKVAFGLLLTKRAPFFSASIFRRRRQDGVLIVNFGLKREPNS